MTSGRQEPKHSGRAIRDRHAVLIIVAVVVVFFRDILLQNAFIWEDFIYQYYAFRNFAAVSLAHGTLPLWNPYTFSGMPFQADIQSALFYIPNLLLTLFVSGDKLHFFWVELIIVAHFVIAGVSMYYFAKELGLEKIYALFSAIAFTLSGFMIMQVIHQTFICQVAWVPLVLLLLRRTLLCRSILSMVCAGLILGHAILAGSPQFTVYIFLLILFYFLFEWVGTVRAEGWKASLPMVPLAAGVVVLAVALTAVQLLPTLELAPLSRRATISFENSSEGSLRWGQIITLVAPKYFGSSGAQETTYAFLEQYWAYWETCIYIGLIPLIMAVLSFALIRKNRYVAFFSGIVAFGFLYCLGNNFVLHSFFFHVVPGFDKFRVPGRMSFFFTFGATILSGFGLRYAVERYSTNTRKMKKLVIVVAGSGVVVLLLAQAGFFQSFGNVAAEQLNHEKAVNAAATTLGLLVIVSIIFFLVLRRQVSTAKAVLVLILFHFIDMNLFGFNQNNGRLSPEQYYAKTSRVAEPLKEEGKKEYFRVNSRDGGYMILDRNQGMIDRIFLLEGYTPLALQRQYPPRKTTEQTYDLLNAKYRIVVDPRDRSMGLREASTYYPRALIVYGDTVVKNEAAAQAYMQSDTFDPLNTVVYEDDPHVAFGKASMAAYSSASIKSYDLNTITLSATSSRDGILLLSEIYYPGWRAYVDGVEQPLYRADWCLRAIPIKAGTHEIVARFEPSTFYRGLIITLVALAISGIIVVLTIVLKRRAVPVSSNIQ
ncbi:MAG: YfhO family protein [Ignavibacteriae bacterium]|nr:YfhO family protein [Ignavibacteria bacterium]MBI3365134.1 YfhO family protein [Ignavibacteriota bacterium]